MKICNVLKGSNIIQNTFVMFFMTMFSGQVFAGTVLHGDLVEVSIQINENPQAAYFFEPSGNIDIKGSTTRSSKYFRAFKAKEGDEYGITIRLKDRKRRYQVAIAIDGRNVIDGKKLTRNYDHSSSWGQAYIFSVDGDNNGGTVLGWRESMDTVRKFVFSKPENSLAATAWDDWSAMGTIVVVVFREEEKDQSHVLTPRCGGLKARGGCSAGGGKGARTRGLGTGAGGQIESRVETGKFKPKDLAYEIFVLRYMAQEDLAMQEIERSFIKFPINSR